MLCCSGLSSRATGPASLTPKLHQFLDTSPWLVGSKVREALGQQVALVRYSRQQGIALEICKVAGTASCVQFRTIEQAYMQRYVISVQGSAKRQMKGHITD